MAGPAVLTVADTIAKSFLLSAETRGDRPAIREKKFGIWQPTSWRQWLQISRDIAFALHDIGFRPGDEIDASRKSAHQRSQKEGQTKGHRHGHQI